MHGTIGTKDDPVIILGRIAARMDLESINYRNTSAERRDFERRATRYRLAQSRALWEHVLSDPTATADDCRTLAQLSDEARKEQQ